MRMDTYSNKVRAELTPKAQYIVGQMDIDDAWRFGVPMHKAIKMFNLCGALNVSGENALAFYSIATGCTRELKDMRKAAVIVKVGGE